MRDRAVWSLRILWFVLPLSAGATIADAVRDGDPGLRTTVVVGAWVLWAIGLLATAIPLPLTLTAVRTAAAAVPVAVGWAMLVSDGVDRAGLVDVAAVVHVIALVAVAFNVLVGDRFVDGASYGDERRMLLRVPTVLLVGPVLVAWVIAVAGLVGGPLLLADRSWVLGAIATLVGLPLAALALRALHQLARRWVVFVPTGFVLHDLLALTEPVLFRRTAIERLGPAIAGTPARDLSLGAPGLLIECELTDPAPLGLRHRAAGADAELVDVRRFLITPSRPGALLDIAESRSIPGDL